VAAIGAVFKPLSLWVCPGGSVEVVGIEFFQHYWDLSFLLSCLLRLNYPLLPTEHDHRHTTVVVSCYQQSTTLGTCC